MNIDLQEILSRFNHQESELCEFKVNNVNPDRIGAIISALANSATLFNVAEAYLIFGINNQGQIVGTNFDINKQHKKQELKNWLTTQLQPAINFDIDSLLIANKKIVVFTIKAASLYPIKFKGQASIRIGSYTKPLINHPDKEKILWQNLSQSRFETKIALANLKQAELLNKLDYKKYFKLKQVRGLSNQNSLIEKLIEFKLAQHSKGRYSITNLGALLMAKDIGDFEGLQYKLPRLIIYKGSDRINTTNDISFHQGYITCLPQIMQYLLDIIPATEKIEQMFRKTYKLYPEKSLRELIVNALIHQDFSIEGMYPTIEVFDNRIEIRNPGQPLIEAARFVDDLKSRNQLLIKEMRWLDFCEERGSGIDNVLVECEFYQLPAPLITTNGTSTTIILYSPQVFKQMTKADKIRTCYLHACLKFINNAVMTNKSLRQRLAINQKQYPVASRIIKASLEAQLIKPDFNKKGYIPYWAESKPII